MGNKGLLHDDVRQRYYFYIDPGDTPYLLLLFTLFIPVDRVTNHVCSGILYNDFSVDLARENFLLGLCGS